MGTLSKLTHRLFKRPSPPTLDSTSQQHLCERCESLQLLSHAERPWTLSSQVLDPNLKIGDIDQGSIDSSCALCAEFEVILYEFVFDDHEHRSLQLYRIFSTSPPLMTEFTIQPSTPSWQVLHFLPTKPLEFVSGDVPMYGRDRWAKHMSAERLSEQPLIPGFIDLQPVKTWISKCYAKHKESCGTRRNAKRRSNRVIDCKHRTLCTNDQPYVCLSYVWGSGSLGVDTLGNALPQTILDAITVTLALGLRYLWIDRYCIDQSNAEEKHNLIKNMNAIYEGGELTIIGAAGIDPTHGLPGVPLKRKTPLSFTVGDRTFAVFGSTISAVNTSRWNTRGWTYQEALLSRRRLVFTDTRVYMQCRSEHFIECEDQRKRWFPSKEDPRIFPAQGIGSWPLGVYDRLSEYYLRDLSYATDNIKAFEGVFQAFSRLRASENSPSVAHFYGVPILYDEQRISGSPNPEVIPPGRMDTFGGNASFALGLAWCSGYHNPSGIVHNDLFPSWTWAASGPGGQPMEMGDQTSLNFVSQYQVIRQLDRSIRICLLHRSGKSTTLIEYLRHQEHYTKFHPLVDITSYVVYDMLEGIASWKSRLGKLQAWSDSRIRWQPEAMPPVNE